VKPSRKSNSARASRLPVDWQDSAWFPPVLAGARFPQSRRQRIFWPVQIITDPTVCLGRTVSL